MGDGNLLTHVTKDVDVLRNCLAKSRGHVVNAGTCSDVSGNIGRLGPVVGTRVFNHDGELRHRGLLPSPACLTMLLRVPFRTSSAGSPATQGIMNQYRSATLVV